MKPALHTAWYDAWKPAPVSPAAFVTSRTSIVGPVEEIDAGSIVPVIVASRGEAIVLPASGGSGGDGGGASVAQSG